MQYDFHASVRGICREYNLDQRQVRETYNDRQEKLSALYQKMASARLRKGMDTALLTFGLVAGAAVVTYPVWICAGLDAFRRVGIMAAVEQEVHADIIAFERGRMKPA
jgi:hypothetical protein